MKFHCGIKALWIWLFCIHPQFRGVVHGLSPLWDSVTTNIYQEYDVEEGDDILTVRVNMGEYSSTDLVVGEDIRKDSRLILACIAHHGPAEWVYSGDGNPNFIKNSTVENLSESGKRLPMHDMNGAKRYIAMLTLGTMGMTTKDTGRYNCMTASPETGMKYKTLSAFYHVYVPAKQKLFIRKSETVLYDLSKSAARIPCGVSNPLASVTLQKFEKGNLKFIPNESMLYHPISGYYPKTDIKGMYICTAAFNNTFDFVHFSLASESSEKNQKVGKRPTKKPNRYTNKPPEDDSEWLLYPNSVTSPTKKPSIKTTTPYSTNAQTPNLSTYVPFHLRYSTTTYAPFQTFYTVQTTRAGSISYENNKYKIRPTVKTKPFNPSNYPSELYLKAKPTKSTAPKRPSHNNNNHHNSHYSSSLESDDNSNSLSSSSSSSNIPTELISYKPILQQLKNNNNQTFQIYNSKKQPAPPIIVLNKEKKPSSSSSSSSSYVRNYTRTTPRKYRPYIITTTPMPIVIPESIICSQFSCGVNAICYASMVYNRTLKKLSAEPGCKCIPNHMGNPYLNCYMPSVMMDPNLLLFNLSAFGRSPFLEEPIYSNGESESAASSMMDNNNGSNEEEEDEDNSNNSGKTDIIDM